MKRTFTDIVGVSPLVAAHVIAILSGTGIAAYMQLKTVAASILLPGCFFMNGIIFLMTLTALRNVQLKRVKATVLNMGTILLPLSFNIYVADLMKDSPVTTTFYFFLVGGIFITILSLLVMVSGTGADVYDGRFADESRFKRQRQNSRPSYEEPEILFDKKPGGNSERVF